MGIVPNDVIVNSRVYCRYGHRRSGSTETVPGLQDGTGRSSGPWTGVGSVMVLGWRPGLVVFCSQRLGSDKLEN